ncbi:MAG: 30S ribosomal protein S8 [Deltaproteobacteria bacterium]|nr:30S ribosomal protein S8 [Candidatus Zymogenaceae bacterium]
MMTDPIADMLTRIRNGVSAKFEIVDVPSSKIKEAIARILVQEGYIESYKVLEDNKQNILRMHLKYDKGKDGVISKVMRVSKPGRRVYVDKGDIPLVLRGYGIAILSTSRGVITDKQARKAGIGGEVICKVW